MTESTADVLYEFIRKNSEWIDGQFVCRASLADYLRLGQPRVREIRTRLVKELEKRGLVQRKHPRSVGLYVMEEATQQTRSD